MDQHYEDRTQQAVEIDIGSWESRFDSMVDEMAALIEQGRWVRGHRDLLSVVWKERDELVHSRVLGWLFDPLGSHALGSAVLGRLCMHLGLDPPGRSDQVSVHIETGSTERRADLIVEMPHARLVIENKVDADEQPDQCAALVDLHDRGDTKFVFLSPDRRSPTTARRQDDWTELSYTEIAGWLHEAVGDPAPSDSVRAYLATLENHLR